MDCSSPHRDGEADRAEGPLRRGVRQRPRQRPPRHRHARRRLMNPNHYLAAAISYLFDAAPALAPDAAVGKTVVSSSIIDRVAGGPGGRWSRCRSGSSGSCRGCSTDRWASGARRARARRSCAATARCGSPRRTGSSWTCSRWRSPRAPAATRRRSTRTWRRSSGAPVYERIDAPATPEEKACPGPPLAGRRTARELAGEPIEALPHGGARQRRSDRRPEGDHAQRLVRGATVRHRSGVQALRRELPRGRATCGGSRRKRARWWRGALGSGPMTASTRAWGAGRHARSPRTPRRRRRRCGGPSSSDTARRPGR